MDPISAKRKQSSPTEDSIDKPAKFHRAIVHTMDSQNISHQLEQILSEISDTKKQQQEGFIKMDAKHETLSKSIDAIAGQFTNKLNEIDKACKMNSTRIDENTDEIQRMHLSNELRITGLSSNEGDNIMERFKALSAFIEFDTNNPTNVPSLSCIKITDKTTGSSSNTGVVRVQFLAAHIKTHFYGLYLQKLPLTLEKIGLTGTNRIYINENLTKNNAKIFSEARKLKKANLFASVYTVNGLVNVKISKGDKASTIRNETDLEIMKKRGEEINNNQTKVSTDSTLKNTPVTTVKPQTSRQTRSTTVTRTKRFGITNSAK